MAAIGTPARCERSTLGLTLRTSTTVHCFGPWIVTANHGSSLQGGAVSLIVKRCAERAHLDTVALSGNSLRAGFATTAASEGASERAIADQTGHRSMDMVRRYVRHASVFTDNAVGTLGL